MPHNGGVYVDDQETPGVVVIAFREDLISEYVARLLEQALNTSVVRWARVEDPRELLDLCTGALGEDEGGTHERAARDRPGTHSTR